MKNQEGKIELQKNIDTRICVRDITFLTARSPFYVFSLLSPSTPSLFPSDKNTYIAMGGILCDDIISKRSKIWKSII